MLVNLNDALPMQDHLCALDRAERLNRWRVGEKRICLHRDRNRQLLAYCNGMPVQLSQSLALLRFLPKYVVEHYVSNTYVKLAPWPNFLLLMICQKGLGGGGTAQSKPVRDERTPSQLKLIVEQLNAAIHQRLLELSQDCPAYNEENVNLYIKFSEHFFSSLEQIVSSLNVDDPLFVQRMKLVSKLVHLCEKTMKEKSQLDIRTMNATVSLRKNIAQASDRHRQTLRNSLRSSSELLGIAAIDHSAAINGFASKIYELINHTFADLKDKPFVSQDDIQRALGVIPVIAGDTREDVVSEEDGKEYLRHAADCYRGGGDGYWYYKKVCGSALGWEERICCYLRLLSDVVEESEGIKTLNFNDERVTATQKADAIDMFLLELQRQHAEELFSRLPQSVADRMYQQPFD